MTFPGRGSAAHVGGSVRAAPAQHRRDRRQGDRVARQGAVRGRRRGTESCTRRFSAPARAAESVGVTTVSEVERSVTQRGPAGVSSPALSRSSRSLSGHELLAGGRAAADGVGRGRRDVGAVVRRSDREHAPYQTERRRRRARTAARRRPPPSSRPGRPSGHRCGRSVALDQRARAGFACTRRSPSSPPVGRKTIACLPSLRSWATSGSRSLVSPPYPGTRITGPSAALVDRRGPTGGDAHDSPARQHHQGQGECTDDDERLSPARRRPGLEGSAHTTSLAHDRWPRRASGVRDQ